MAFTDDFTGTENDGLDSRTGWTRVDGTANAAQINGANQCKSTTGTETAYQAPSAGSADHYAQLVAGSTYVIGGSATAFAPCVRVQDKSNFIGVRCNSSVEIQVFKRVGGTFTQLLNSSSIPSAGDTVRLEIAGSTAKLLVNGVQVGSDMSVSDLGTVETPGIVCRTIASSSWFDDWESTEEAGGGGTFQSAWARGSNIIIQPGR